MLRHVKAESVSHFFSPDEKHRFFIPKYQREYVWRREDWEALFNDLEESEEGYFLGSIICVNTENDSTAGVRLELIDGQQRFTTISLLLAAFFSKLKSVSNPDDELSVEIINLQNRIYVKGTDQWRFEPSEQSQNKSDLRKILSDLFPKKTLKPKNLRNFGNRRIAKAYAYFEDRLQNLSDDDALVLLDKLKSAILVKIEVPRLRTH